MTVVRGLNDPEHVVRQYETEAGLAARKAVYKEVTGPDAREMAVDEVLRGSPERVLEVGCGEGELAERLAGVVSGFIAIDQSPRMVELTQARGVDARVGDVQQLPFPDDSFDAVLAAWMLYHVPDLDRGLAEIKRVLRPHGRLVATTNGADHLGELLALGGIERWDLPFRAENAAELLGGHFASVERRDAYGTVTFRDIDVVRSYFGSSERLADALERLPETLEAPLVARRLPVVFVATEHA
jgi:ubiquinone/menaquinone biosynthesis C-methylase UbiE